MKKIITFVLLCFLGNWLFAQKNALTKNPDSLRLVLKQAINDTVKLEALYHLGNYYIESNADSSLFFTEEAIPLLKKLRQPLWSTNFLLNKAYVLMHQGNYPLSFKLVNEVMAIAKDEKNENGLYLPNDDEFAGLPHQFRLSTIANSFHQMGNLHTNAGNKESAIACFKEEIKISEQIDNKSGIVESNMNIGYIYLGLDKLDSALLYSRKALENSNASGYKTYQGNMLNTIGSAYFKQQQLDSAMQYYRQAVAVSREQNNLSSETLGYINLAKLFKTVGGADSLMYYAKTALHSAANLKAPARTMAAMELLADAYKVKGNIDSAFACLVISKQLDDSLNTERNIKIAQFQNINLDEQVRLEKLEQENTAYRNKVRTTALFIGLGLLSVLALLFYRNNRQKQKANKVLETTLTNLKSTQSQLVQSEKMASLGELTAGIAHEIQNPLNFVNNFSEVNAELITEMKEEIEKGNLAEVKIIANDIADNEQKINHHGKRADAIVKGMLQHSRSSNGVKEPTNINALADEYLRLAYHGLRAKDNSFNAALKTNFDESIGNINIIPQDIGRVILNLITNAFYAVDEKKKQSDSDYEPTVTVSTSRSLSFGEGRGEVQIKVADNGNGIPKNILNKIFQPFFTTKPTGQGTGLGLSLSYDIIKAHGGELKAETKEGYGTEFIIQLPVKV